LAEQQKTTVWPLDPHTEAKHVLLRKYLNAWLPIITRYNGRVIFCDGFAGPGIYSNGQDGSPVIAIKALVEHAYFAQMKAEVVYMFIEERADRCKSLAAIVKKIKLPANVKVTIINKTYEEAFTQVLDYIDSKSSKLAPTFAFIDPFGIKGLPLETIKRLMKHAKCEVFITIMVGFIHRFVSTPEFEPHCDALFGTDEWRAALDLQGPEREQFLRELYQSRLLNPKTGVGAKYARYFTMKDGKKKTIYDLFFATNHSKGIDSMKDAMWRVDQSGGFSFSDATDPNQVTLFTAEPDWSQLFDLLQAGFKGADVPWPTVEEAIRRGPFRILRTPLKIESIKPDSRFKIVNPPAIRKGTLDADTVIRFP
jgi:three-Cys-motif partner protein